MRAFRVADEDAAEVVEVALPPPLPPLPPEAVAVVEVVTPGVVHALSVPRYGICAFETGTHVGYEGVVNGHIAVVVSVVVVLPAV